jgi:hypothetical protein
MLAEELYCREGSGGVKKDWGWKRGKGGKKGKFAAATLHNIVSRVISTRGSGLISLDDVAHIYLQAFGKEYCPIVGLLPALRNSPYPGLFY